MSPAELLLSAVGRLPGAGVKSLKVVKTSDWLADVLILSSARASWSLSACEETEIDAKDSRRDGRSVVEDLIDGDSGGCLAVLLLLAMPGK